MLKKRYIPSPVLMGAFSDVLGVLPPSVLYKQGKYIVGIIHLDDNVWPHKIDKRKFWKLCNRLVRTKEQQIKDT